MAPRWRPARWLLLAALLLGPACRVGTGGPAVSDDPGLQLKYETALQALADIERSKRTKHDVYADCKTAEMLFYRDLRKLEAPPAQRLLKDLQTACRGVTPP